MKFLSHFLTLFVIVVFIVLACSSSSDLVEEETIRELEQLQLLEQDNPIRPLPTIPLGLSQTFEELENPPRPERVRLGRWLFFDKRISADGTISCATCHKPEHAFSEVTAVSTGISGQKGNRKAPSFVNQAWTIYPVFFWDGRAASLEEQAKGPMINPIEMGNAHDVVVKTLQASKGYIKYFQESFGTSEISIEHVAKAIADYERTRISGNSAWDRWKNGDESAVSALVKLGDEVFFAKAECNQCHLGQNFTDSKFHNLGIGWNAKTKSFVDEGRFKVTKAKEDLGAFKTPTLRDVTLHPPFMHDGSIATLEEAVEHYNKGGTKNPNLSPKIKSLKLSKKEKKALVAFMESLVGQGYQDESPKIFPQ